MKYVYPAIFTPDDDGFSIYFPDIGMGATQGDDIVDGLEMAHDFLVGAMIMLEDTDEDIPLPSNLSSLALSDGQFASFVSVDTTEHRRKTESKAIKKTLTLPSWLNARAEDAGVNFSQLLQKALKEELQIAD